MADPVNQVELPAYALPQRSETGRKFKDLVQRNNSTRWANCGREQVQPRRPLTNLPKLRNFPPI
jgi:hypothetical protein